MSERVGIAREGRCGTFYELLTKDEYNHLRLLAIRFARNTLFAEEVLQTALTKALARFDQYQQGTDFHAWMATIVINTWKTAVRDAKSRNKRGMSFPDGFDAPCDGDPLAVLETREAVRAVAKWAEGGNQEMVRALLMNTADGYMYREIADALGVPIGTVMSRIGRARASLIGFLEKHGI